MAASFRRGPARRRGAQRPRSADHRRTRPVPGCLRRRGNSPLPRLLRAPLRCLAQRRLMLKSIGAIFGLNGPWAGRSAPRRGPTLEPARPGEPASSAAERIGVGVEGTGELEERAESGLAAPGARAARPRCVIPRFCSSRGRIPSRQVVCLLLAGDPDVRGDYRRTTPIGPNNRRQTKLWLKLFPASQAVPSAITC